MATTNNIAISAYLQQFKAAGIYRVVYDKSAILNVDAQKLRLVVGYSEKGPFNCPTYIASPTEFISIYGNISKKLEKRGIYFHRLALQALKNGPILALNLKKFSGETVDVAYFNPTDLVINKGKALVEDIYETNRFWYLEPSKLNTIKTVRKAMNLDGTQETGELEYGLSLEDYYIKIAATSIKDTSNTIFIRPASGNKILPYKVTVQDWYKMTNEDMPDFFEGYEETLMSEYFAEIYVFRGKFTPAAVLSSEVLSRYFYGSVEQVENPTTHKYEDQVVLKLRPTMTDAFGDTVDTLDQLFKEELARPMAHYVGSLVPYFKDQQGAYQSLDLLFNSDNDVHNMMMTFNEDLLDKVDAVEAGRVMVGEDDFGNPIYKKTYTNYAGVINMSGTSAFWKHDNASGDETHMGDIVNTDFLKALYNGEALSGTLGIQNSIINVAKINVEYGENAEIENEKHLVQDVNGVEPGESGYITTYEKGYTPLEDGNETHTTIKFKDIPNTPVEREDDEVSDDVVYNDSVVFCQIVDAIPLRTGVNEDGQRGLIEAIEAMGLKPYSILPRELILADNAIVVPNDSLPKMLHAGDRLVSTKSGKLTTVNSVGTFEVDKYTYSYITSSVEIEKINQYVVRVDNSLNSETGDIKPIYLEGYTFNNDRPKVYDNLNKIWRSSNQMYHKLQWQKEILSTLTDYKGIRVALLNKSEIDYRYIVDTFESYVESNCKSVFSYLAKQKQSAFAIVNFPSVQTFVKCPYTSFVNEKGAFNVQYVVDGYNKKKVSSVKFSIPAESDGASFMAYYTPLKFSDGSLKTYVPSAGLVSNLFIEKYKSRQPYFIVAGPNYGLINESGLEGPDYNYSTDELQIIEPFGVNCMVYRPNFGTFINANQTAKQIPLSSLSRVNVRELVIYLQDEIEKLLQRYQWEFNNPQTRLAIKDRADQICERVKANGGLIVYKNVIDESNNTPDVIDNEMCILSTHIEAGKGCGKMVQELTIYRTGGMSALITES